MLEKSLLREDDKKIRIKSHDDDTFNGDNLRRRVSRGKKKKNREDEAEKRGRTEPHIDETMNIFPKRNTRWRCGFLRTKGKLSQIVHFLCSENFMLSYDWLVSAKYHTKFSTKFSLLKYTNSASCYIQITPVRIVLHELISHLPVTWALLRRRKAGNTRNRLTWTLFPFDSTLA